MRLPAPAEADRTIEVCSWAVAEVRLAAGDDRVDVAVAVGPGVLARLRLLDHPDRVMRAWGRSAGALAGVGYLWRERDAGAKGTSVVYAEVESAAPPVVAVAEALRGEPAAPPARALLERAQERLPPAARVVHVGDLKARGVDATRLVVRAPREAVVDWLRGLGWEGAVAALERTLTRLAVGHSHVAVQVDLSDRPLPRVGVELYHPSRGGLDPRWAALGDALITEGLADPLRALGLVGWACGLGAPPLAIGAQVKVGIGAEGSREAKGYLAWGPSAIGACASTQTSGVMTP